MGDNTRIRGVCSVDGCKRHDHIDTGYCVGHARRIASSGSPGGATFKSQRWTRPGTPSPFSRFIAPDGYARLSMRYRDPDTGRAKQKSFLEHRLVMENHLRRALETYERVHHRNGNRVDNRLENLELVHVTSHHNGQKVSDLHEEIRRLRDRIPYAIAGDDLRLVA